MPDFSKMLANLKLGAMNWKTTLAGSIAAGSVAAHEFDKLGTAPIKDVAAVVGVAVGVFLWGLVSKDADKTGAGEKVNK